MMNVQKEALKQASEILNNLDTYPIYREVSMALSATGVDKDISKLILGAVESESAKLRAMEIDAKKWIDSVLSDI